MPFTDRPHLGTVTLCPAKDNLRMMEGRGGKLTVQKLQEQRSSKTTSYTIPQQNNSPLHMQLYGQMRRGEMSIHLRAFWETPRKQQPPLLEVCKGKDEWFKISLVSLCKLQCDLQHLLFDCHKHCYSQNIINYCGTL